MPFSVKSASDKTEDLQALRILIEEVARQHGIDFLDRSVTARVMDGDTTIVYATGIEPERYADLSSMLRLLTVSFLCGLQSYVAWAYFLPGS